MNPKDAGKRIKEVSVPPAKKSQFKKWLIRISVSIILILSTVFAGVYWKYIYLPAPADIDPEGRMEFNLPEGPSIAVLPFVNMRKDPEQEYFCDGMTGNIISTLAQTQQLIVIARNSTFAYKNKSIDVRQIGHELNAKYVIEGSIQKSIDRVRIVVQLIDADSREHIWSEHYDREFKDVFNLYDEIALKILKAVGIELISFGNDRNFFEGLTDNNSLIKIFKVMEYVENPTRDGFESALKNVEETIALNPKYSHRYDGLAAVYLAGLSINACAPPLICALKASQAVKKSLSLDGNNWLAYQMEGWIFQNKRKHDKAILAYKKSLEINPSNANAYWIMGYMLNSADEPAKALESMKIAFRLNPAPPINYFFNLGWSYNLLKKYEEAIEAYKTVLKRQPNSRGVYLSLAICYAYAGQEEKAKTAVKKLLALDPDYTIAKYQKTAFYSKNHAIRIKKSVKALRKAGLPE